MKNKLVIATSTLVAGAIVTALILRPSRSISPLPELAASEHILPAARAIIRNRMHRHSRQVSALLSEAVVLDYAAAARTAGEIFDEGTFARPLTGDELNGLLPERFFVLQDELRTEARRVVKASVMKDSVNLATELGALTATCIACHDLYLHASP